MLQLYRQCKSGKMNWEVDERPFKLSQDLNVLQLLPLRRTTVFATLWVLTGDNYNSNTQFLLAYTVRELRLYSTINLEYRSFWLGGCHVFRHLIKSASVDHTTGKSDVYRGECSGNKHLRFLLKRPTSSHPHLRKICCVYLQKSHNINIEYYAKLLS